MTIDEEYREILKRINSREYKREVMVSEFREDLGIMAGSVNQYEYIRRLIEKANPDKYKMFYISSLNNLRGKRSKILYYGTWYERRDSHEIRQYLLSLGVQEYKLDYKIIGFDEYFDYEAHERIRWFREWLDFKEERTRVQLGLPEYTNELNILRPRHTFKVF